jgi:D-alanyl-D-alanine carboxypeptidase
MRRCNKRRHNHPMKRSEKIIFLLVVIAAIFFARFMYPNISGVPQIQTADQSEVASAQTQSDPPLLTLPQTSVVSPNSTAGSVVAPASSTPSDQLTTSTDSVFTQVGVAPVPSFDSEAYMVADLTTGAVLAESNDATRWPTASLTKLMSATLIFDQLPTSTDITITPQMFSYDPSEETLVVGDEYSVEDLLHVMLMPSSNVAVESMATYLGRTQFLAEMNARAKQWGMNNSYFADTSGISASNESTPNDMLILATHVYNDYPGILAITDTHQTTITEINTGQKVLVTSITTLRASRILSAAKPVTPNRQTEISFRYLTTTAIP